MQQLIGQPIFFLAAFTKAGYWFNPAGVTVTVKRRRADNAVVETVATAAAAESMGLGAYARVEGATSVAGLYVAIFETTDTTVDRRAIAVQCLVGDLWTETVFAKASLIAGQSVQTQADSFADFDSPLSAQSFVRFSTTLQIVGRSISGWTALAFTVKASAVDDADGEALLTVRNSNPAVPGTDGIVWHRGAALPPSNILRGSGGIIAVATAPDTTLVIALTGAAMNLPTSPDNDPFTYEVDVWRAGDKEQIAKGEFAIGQSVRRSVAIP